MIFSCFLLFYGSKALLSCQVLPPSSACVKTSGPADAHGLSDEEESERTALADDEVEMALQQHKTAYEGYVRKLHEYLTAVPQA